MGQLAISMAVFSSYVELPEGMDQWRLKLFLIKAFGFRFEHILRVRYSDLPVLNYVEIHPAN